ncbi:zinc ribbon domain-containing protein [Halomicroarcula sp. GCM10025709]|uniref:zinc ribbon domain-containing protein n=1 Tax=Haloarcula TaxID=2237 RepID=UPI0024C431E5|nr:zinc ribbon domain-containing protein [Halomicroarcula sp. YJ-61-S]
MRTDPRCPHCNEKVSATASWCMHCGQDFDEPREAGSGELTEALARGDGNAIADQLVASEYGPGAVGVAIAAVALVTLPIVSPPGLTFFYLAAVVAIGYLSAQRPTVADALARGAQLLALAPFLLWLLSALLYAVPPITALLGPIVYAALVLLVVRRIDPSLAG